MTNRILILAIVISLALLPFSSDSQIAGNNFIPFELENINVEWSHVSYDSTIVGHILEGSTATHDGYSHLWPFYNHNRFRLIEDGYIYLIHRTLYDNDVSGALIEKLNLETGELIWNITFDQRTQDLPEYVTRAKIEGNRLILYNLLITTEDEEQFGIPIVWAGWVEGYLKIREYDIRDGSLISESIPDTSLNLKLIENQTHEETVMNVLDDDVIEILHHEWLDEGPVVIIDTINRDGAYTNAPDTLYSLLGDLDWASSWRPSGYLLYRDFFTEKLYWLDFYTKQPWSLDSTRANINIYHKDEIEVIPIVFPGNEDVVTWSLIDVVDGKMLLKLYYRDDDDTVSYVLLDETGLLLWKVDLSGQGIRFIQVDEDNSFVITKGSTMPSSNKSQIDVFKLEDGVLENKGNFILKDENYFMYGIEIQTVENNKYLISVEYIENGNIGNHKAIFKVDGREIGIDPAVYTENLLNIGDELTIYPNPFSDSFSFDSQHNNRIIKMYSATGEFILSKKVHLGLNSISTSDIDPGMYYITMELDNYKITKAAYKY